MARQVKINKEFTSVWNKTKIEFLSKEQPSRFYKVLVFKEGKQLQPTILDKAKWRLFCKRAYGMVPVSPYPKSADLSLNIDTTAALPTPHPISQPVCRREQQVPVRHSLTLYNFTYWIERWKDLKLSLFICLFIKLGLFCS